jgi:hypothetical protein
MKTTNSKIYRNFLLSLFSVFFVANLISAAPVSRTVAGANPAAIQATVDQFRQDLGGNNNGVGNSFTSGRREINWDAVPDTFSAPNFLPVNFFNANSPRGVVFSSSSTFNNTSAFLLSADSSNPTNTPVRFADIDQSYSASFQAFSAERIFTARLNNLTEVNFFIPGTSIPATVSGFGVVFTDVDQAGPTYVKYYGTNGQLLTFQSAPVANNGLSFVGVSFNAGERIARVEIISGNAVLANGSVDGGGNDVVAMDDFIYGEPRAAEYHSSDFDGDGTSDRVVFRPSIGTWFVLNSGSNTVSIAQFGANGDQPLEGDFDGDKRSDLAIYRPTDGSWFVLRSSSGSVFGLFFGSPGDKPVPADYDKDGLTDVAVFRPSSGTWLTLTSSSNFTAFQGVQFGANGDIAPQTSGQ